MKEKQIKKYVLRSIYILTAKKKRRKKYHVFETFHFKEKHNINSDWLRSRKY
jgi:hypothetical protein